MLTIFMESLLFCRSLEKRLYDHLTKKLEHSYEGRSLPPKLLYIMPAPLKNFLLIVKLCSCSFFVLQGMVRASFAAVLTISLQNSGQIPISIQLNILMYYKDL